MNQLFSIFTYGLVAMVISLATSLQAAPNEAYPGWKVSTTKDWQGFISKSKGIKVADGHAIAQKREVSFTSKLKKFAKPAKLRDIELKQSVEWMNWKPYSIYNLNMRNAPVLISHGPNDHWAIAQYRSAEQIVEWHQKKVEEAKNKKRKPPPPLGFTLDGFEPEEVSLEGYDEKLVTTPFPNQYRPAETKAEVTDRPYQRAWKSGYHAWHSRDMINWVHYGPTAMAPTVTTAEYKDGKTYFYYDRPNDRDPHLIIDSDLRDGMPGEDKGLAFDAPWGGSDVGVIRDLEGKFHMISENWQPINASKRSWDSPLASHMVSDDGIGNFKILEHAVDYRTKPTDRTATFEHPHWNDEEKVVTYEIHEPEQDAFGDWAVSYETAKSKRLLREQRERAAGLKGTTAALRFEVQGIVGGEPALVVEHVTRMCDDIAPDWPQGKGYAVFVEGEPRMHLVLDMEDRHGDHAVGGVILTATRIVNAIPAVVEARAGMLSSLDLPMVTGKGLYRPD